MRCGAQADGVEFVQRPLGNVGLGQAGVFAQRESDVFEHVQIGEQGALLEQHAHALAQGLQFVGVGAADVLAERMHLALPGDELAGGRAQQRGLARARAAHDGDHFARAHVHGDVAQDGEITIA
ncbi:hypothetical protein D3C71_1500200 [compost metagenome]